MRKALRGLAFLVVIAGSRGIYRWRKLCGLQLQRSSWEGVTDGAWDESLELVAKIGWVEIHQARSPIRSSAPSVCKRKTARDALSPAC